MVLALFWGIRNGDYTFTAFNFCGYCWPGGRDRACVKAVSKSTGVMAGLALNPATPLNVLDQVLPMLDVVLVMCVEPGFAGQKFIESSVDKIKELRKIIDSMDPDERPLIEVDGG